MGYEMVTTRCFSVMSGVKVGLALVHLSLQYPNTAVLLQCLSTAVSTAVRDVALQ